MRSLCSLALRVLLEPGKRVHEGRGGGQVVATERVHQALRQRRAEHPRAA